MPASTSRNRGSQTMTITTKWNWDENLLLQCFTYEIAYLGLRTKTRAERGLFLGTGVYSEPTITPYSGLYFSLALVIDLNRGTYFSCISCQSLFVSLKIVSTFRFAYNFYWYVMRSCVCCTSSELKTDPWNRLWNEFLFRRPTHPKMIIDCRSQWIFAKFGATVRTERPRFIVVEGKLNLSKVPVESISLFMMIMSCESE